MEGVRGLAVSSDFLAWLQAQGLSSETSCAVVNELSIKSQQALLDCTEPTTVRAELYSIAREKLPFVLYAELRRFVESRYQQLRLDPSPAPVGLPTLISVLGSLLESLSLEYSHYAHKLRSLGAEQSHNEAAVMGSEETVSSMDVKIVNVCTWNPELGRTAETENEKVQLEERRYVPSSVSVQEPSNNVIDENVIDENYQGEDWFPDSNQLEPGMLADIKVEPGIVLDVQDPELAASAFGEALGGVTNELSQRAILGFGSSVHQVSRDAFSGQGNGQQAVCHLDVESSSLTAMARMGNELDPHLGNGFEELPLVPSESTPMAHGYLRQQGKRPIGRPRKDDQLVFQDTRNWPLLCTQCGKGFASRSSLIIHMRSHTGEKPYPCKYCGRAFSSSSNLAAHEKRHMSGKMFTCRDCGKSFRTKSQLAVHCKCHFGEKRFHVRQRSRVFPTKSTLAEHKMHVPKTLNLCFICGKRVRCPSALSVHMRCHTGEKPFECKLCGRSFTLKSNLKRHHVLHCKIK